MENLEINVRSSQVEVAVRKLIKSIVEDTNVTVIDQSDLWSICDQLSVESFAALKKNAYFSDFLRSISIAVLSRDDSYTVTERKCVALDDYEARIVLNAETNMKYANDADKITLQTEQIRLPSLSTHLNDLQLPDRFLKLVKRLRNISQSHATFRLGETLADLVSLSTSDLTSLPGIGELYVESLKDLKLLIQSASIDELEETPVVENQFDFASVDISNMRLSHAGVDAKFSKALEKYARHIGSEDLAEHLYEILKFDRNTLITLPGFGIGVVDKLIEFRNLIQGEIKSIIDGRVSYEELQSTLVVPKVFGEIPLEKMEKVLLEDIDAYFDKISENEVDIAQRRWGFIETKQTLEEIAEDFDVSRERIRQIEAKINSSFLRHLRISQCALWQLLEAELSSNTKTKVKNLFSCFSSEKDFYEFLDLVCGKEKLIEYVYPNVDKTVLNTYFAENGAPIHIDDIREIFSEIGFNNIRIIDNAIQYLAQQGALLIEGEFIWPRQLGKAEASACVLVNHDRGLPWVDVAKLVNSNGYSRTDICEDRLDHEAFKLPDYIFLAGKGIYKHTRFIDAEAISLDDIFIEIMEYAESDKRNVFHLMECYHSSNHLQKYDYFVIRYFVKQFGEDYGFYFDGRSQSDSVGLEKGFKNITQKDVIIEAMNRSEKPLTKPEIANLLKSKSRGHAAFYVDGLISEGKIVQVDRMLYTTPESAYKNIQIDKYVDAIGKVLNQYAKPVEPSILKEELNRLFSKSYSKFFYASIARLYAKKQGWFRKHSIYSVNEIPFKNLNALLDSICSSNIPTNENIILLLEHIAITREAASVAFSNWYNKPEKGTSELD